MVKAALALIVALVFGLASPAAAQEKIGDKRVYHTLKSEVLAIPDKEGHVLVVSETHGYDINDGRTVVNRVIVDLVKGNGELERYQRDRRDNGEVFRPALAEQQTDAFHAEKSRVEEHAAGDGAQPVRTQVPAALEHGLRARDDSALTRLDGEWWMAF